MAHIEGVYILHIFPFLELMLIILRIPHVDDLLIFAPGFVEVLAWPSLHLGSKKVVEFDGAC